ncbi:hypothetical protein SAMN04488688_102246 [Paenibacillus sp. cl141a]|uniref:hypothetical protein n=1 Tax=Bacillales TaxID=1385 RepID=UPI000178823A|nr:MULTISPECIES: hypothetical protein [unclassified Paenibacillus]ACX67488.1 conserved hypothetical protein [Paenibacillus sp. Y412MC10]SEK78076.1 hypothetical protein SAMN04488688_102246 [Paenibacillus sp. cl141a]
MMETFGRGCLYLIIGMVVLLLFALLLGTTITIPWFIFIPLVVIAFAVAASKSKRKDDD